MGRTSLPVPAARCESVFYTRWQNFPLYHWQMPMRKAPVAWGQRGFHSPILFASQSRDGRLAESVTGLKNILTRYYLQVFIVRIDANQNKDVGGG